MSSQISEPTKKQMRIALVGIRPADQVTLKGYLRVLLRLDVDLAWISATESTIDLFMINDEFRTAASVTKLLQTHQGVPVLYINHSTHGDGTITQNLLTLPLKQISLLNDWLIRHVTILNGSTPAIKNSATFSNNPIQKTTEPSTNTQAAAQTVATQSAHTTPSSSSVNPTGSELIQLIKTIQQRPEQTCELVQDGQAVAIMDLNRQRVWVNKNITHLNGLSLRTYHGQTPKNEYAHDANTWLWQQAWEHGELITNLINNTTRHQLRFWIKPPVDSRRDLLQIMTALESQALSAVEIAGKAGVSIATAKQALASLLFAGNLSQASYDNLSLAKTIQHTSQQTIQASSEPLASPPPKNEPATSAPPSPEQQEKVGFLARLRKKLGL